MYLLDEEALRGAERGAVRGGSWLHGAWRARSAGRGAFGASLRDDDLGFRLCLRSIEPGQAPGRPGGQVGFAPGERAVSSLPRDEAGSPS